MLNTNVAKLAGYAHMIAVLRSLEAEMGLTDLTPLERCIVATLSLDEFSDGARTESILTHDILDSPTPSSFYRALKKLRQNNIVETVGERKTGIYRICS